MADRLSQYSTIGFVRGCRMSPRNIRIQIASFAACITATYLYSVVDNETRACFLEFHQTAPPSMQKAYPEITCQCSCEFPSASLYPSILNRLVHPASSQASVPPLPNINFASFVPFRYLITLFTASQCMDPGFDMNRAR